MWDIQKATYYLDKSVNTLAKYLKLGTNFRDLNQLQPTAYKKTIFDDEDSTSRKTKKIRVLFAFVKSFLQSGAVKSQSMLHNQALESANCGKFY
jgi:hypothetical protein